MILIREWFKESQNTIPEHIEEAIYYLGQSYAFIWKKTESDLLFNGNNNSNNSDFDNYLKRLGYNFKNENHDFGGYILLKNKKICLAMDCGSTPNSKYTNDYQAGALSFEIITNGKKLISNCGYYKKNNLKLNELSKSTAAQNTLVIDDNSSCKFTGKYNYSKIKRGLKILKREIKKNEIPLEEAIDDQHRLERMGWLQTIENPVIKKKGGGIYDHCAHHELVYEKREIDDWLKTIPVSTPKQVEKLKEKFWKREYKHRELCEFKKNSKKL